MILLTNTTPKNPPDQRPRQLLLYGAGGHAKVVLSLACALGLLVPMVFDDDPAKTTLLDIRVVSPYQSGIYLETPILIAIGNNHIRQALSARVQHLISLSVAHPSAIIDATARFGAGTVVLPGAIVQADVQIGQHVIVNTGASVDHECIIQDFAQIGPGAILCGNVWVGEGTLIGAGAVVLPGVSVGAWVTVGAGSVVTRDVPNGATVWGNPARKIERR